MKKWIVLAASAALIVAGWAYARTLRYTPEWLKPKTARIDRGDIRVPITAAGLIEPDQRIEVKSEASGEVIRVAVAEGDFVRAGDVLVELKKEDEQRSVDRAQAALERVEALLAQARVQVAQAELNVEIARARVRELEAQLGMAEFQRTKVRELAARSTGMTNREELVNAEGRYEVTLAQLEAARANVRAAENSVEEARATVRNQEANQREAIKALEDARERLAETTITSKHDAIVTEVRIRVGMLVQSGVNTFTGGTLLMTLADISRLKVLTRVDEADVGEIMNIAPIEALPEIETLREAARSDLAGLSRRSGRVKVTVDALRDQVFEGVIQRVEPQGRINTGSSVIQFNVLVDITDPHRFRLPLGAQAQVEFTVQNAVNVLRVPAEAVKTYQNDRGVWVKVPAPSGAGERYGKKFVPCRFGITDGEFTELLEVLGEAELSEGQEVYTRLPVSDEQRGD